MAVSPTHNGWRFDPGNSRLDMYYRGTRVGSIDANSVDFILALTNTLGITSSGPTAGIGYATGAGGSVTQITSRTTGVTLNTITGAITTDTTSLAAEGSAEFTVTDSAVAVGDTVVVCERSGSNSGGTIVFCSGVAAGSFNITVHNGNVAAGTAETGAIIINFAVIKAVSA